MYDSGETLHMQLKVLQWNNKMTVNFHIKNSVDGNDSFIYNLIQERYSMLSQPAKFFVLIMTSSTVFLVILLHIENLKIIFCLFKNGFYYMFYDTVFQ